MRNGFFESVQELTKLILLGERDKAMEELTVLALDRGNSSADGLEAIQRGRADSEAVRRRSFPRVAATPSPLTELQRAAL